MAIPRWGVGVGAEPASRRGPVGVEWAGRPCAGRPRPGYLPVEPPVAAAAGKISFHAVMNLDISSSVPIETRR